MIVVDFYEFCDLPDGTVFSYWEPCVTEGLYVRGMVIMDQDGPRDFFETSLLAVSYNGEYPEIDETYGRWGLFNYEQKFAVYEKADIEKIIGQLRCDAS